MVNKTRHVIQTGQKSTYLFKILQYGILHKIPPNYRIAVTEVGEKLYPVGHLHLIF